VKFHLNNTKENEIDIEKEWKNLQKVLKPAANESLGTIKRQNRRKYLKIWDDQIKQLIEKKKNYIKMAEFKETRRQTGIQKKHTLAKREVRRRQRISWDKFVTNLEHETCSGKPVIFKKNSVY
jgi:vacuolar-type H+-ATPase subunit E/Vma4